MVEKGMRVGVLLGGLSAERPISFKSGKAVLAALQSRGWDAVAVEVGRDLPQRLIEQKIDVAWIALHGRFGEDGCVQGVCEVMGIPYTGSGVKASAVAMDKIATKRALTRIPEIVQARDVVVRRGDPLPELVPCCVKPSVGGSTIGTTIVKDRAALEAAITEALKYDVEVLVEELVVGDEITVPVLDGVVLPTVGIRPDSGVFDFASKYTSGMTKYESPAPISAAATASASAAAAAAYRALGCAGLARADFIVRASDDVPVFLEINTIPGMTETSLSPMASSRVGISFAELVEKVLLGAHCMPSEL